MYQSDASEKANKELTKKLQASWTIASDCSIELDENNNPVASKKIPIGEIGKQQHISQRNSQQSGLSGSLSGSLRGSLNSSQQSGSRESSGQEYGGQQSQENGSLQSSLQSQQSGSQDSPQTSTEDDSQLNRITRSRPSRSGRISRQIVKLNQADIGQIKLISLLILSATFIILLLEIAILIRSNSLVHLTVLTAFALVSMVCNFKNNFDSIGQINLLIFIIERTLKLGLSFVNRFNLYKGRRRRRSSIRID